jgi:hypothetical protein
LTQVDVSQPDEINRLFQAVQSEFGTLDIFVNNARPEAPTFFYPPMEITLEQWTSRLIRRPKHFWWEGGKLPTQDEGRRAGSLP